MQLKYSNYVAFSHDHGFAVNNSSLLYHFSSDSNCKNFIFSYFRKTLCYAQLSPPHRFIRILIKAGQGLRASS